jgi:hypothetical protein
MTHRPDFSKMTPGQFKAWSDARHAETKAAHDAKVAAGYKLVAINGHSGPAKWVPCAPSK